jgi:hypothetical protein
MRTITMLAGVLAFTACATTEPKPAAAPAEAAPAKAEPAKAEPAPAAPAADALAPVQVEFISQSATASGGAIQDTAYSEKAEDVTITKREIADGLLTYTGQVGMGKGSSYAGIGLYVELFKGGKTLDATKYKSVTFRLASTAGNLRLRIAGSDQKIREGGCYPVVTQAVTPTPTDYTIPLSKFQAEGWCGSKAVSAAATLKELYGYEVADITIAKTPVTISVGNITLNP